MARGKVNKLYRSFVKGLITEAGYLTYPENASTDELNTILKRKGSRSRRLGLDYEPNSTGTLINTFDQSTLTTEFHWQAVNNDADTNFLCLQIGSDILFFNTDATPIDGALKSFSIDLLDHKTSTSTDIEVQTAYVEMAAGKDFLFIVQKFISPLVVEYDADTDDIIVSDIVIQMRDFDGLNDDLMNDEEPVTLTAEHFYNLRNQGWVTPGSTDVGPGGDTSVPAPPSYGDGGGYAPPWDGGDIP